MLNTYSHALVRPPGASFARALAEHPQSIDVARAQSQHAEYVTALRAAKVEVGVLPVAEEYPDSCFVQDPALVLGGLAILNRMGARSREGEAELLASALTAGFDMHKIEPPGTLEGGDVLLLGERLLVGQTARTNAAGITQLRDIVEPRGYRVERVPLSGYLHLLTVVTALGDDRVVVHPDFAEYSALRGLRRLIIPREEAYAANVLGLGAAVIVPAGFPRTAALLRAEGFDVLSVPLTEFAKADGGASCLSLVW